MLIRLMMHHGNALFARGAKQKSARKMCHWRTNMLKAKSKIGLPKMWVNNPYNWWQTTVHGWMQNPWGLNGMVFDHWVRLRKCWEFPWMNRWATVLHYNVCICAHVKVWVHAHLQYYENASTSTAISIHDMTISIRISANH